MAQVMIIEAYVEAGMSFFEALEKVDEIGRPEVVKVPKPEDEAAGMDMLMAQMSRTGFKGAKL